MSVAATPTTYPVKLKLRHEVALETMAFHFEKLAGFRLTAGQFIDMTLTNPHRNRRGGQCAILFACGIGITPFRRRLVWAAKEQLPCSTRTGGRRTRHSSTSFTLEKKNPNYTLIATMTDM